MLKHRIYKLDEVAPKFQGIYEKQADGSYLLDEEARPDNTDLLAFTQQLKDEKKKIKEQKEAATARLQELEEAETKRKEAALKDEKKFNELAALKEAEFATALKAKEDAAALATSTLTSHILTQQLGELASALAGDNAALLKPHLAQNVRVTLVDGIPKTVFMQDGKEVTKEVFTEAIVKTKMFAPILKGRNSSGGGSGGQGGGNQSVSAAAYAKYFDPDNSEYNLSKQIELMKSDKAAHDKLVAQYNLAGY